MVVRQGRKSAAEFWPIGPVPLWSGDADARLDLKAALDDAAYESRIYKRAPDPPPRPS